MPPLGGHCFRHWGQKDGRCPPGVHTARGMQTMAVQHEGPRMKFCPDGHGNTGGTALPSRGQLMRGAQFRVDIHQLMGRKAAQGEDLTYRSLERTTHMTAHINVP